jgi:tetratricopeptide (TPR) repeat protein
MRGLLSEIGNKKSQRAFDILPEIFDFYLRTNELDSASVYLQRIKKLDNAVQHQAAIHQLTGDYYSARGDSHLAEQAYLKARTVILRQQGVRHEAMARCDLALGNLYLHINEPEQALSYFHRSLFNMSDQAEALQSA